MIREEKIRSFGFAVSFYPSEKEELEKLIDELFERTKEIFIPGSIFGVLVPQDSYFLAGKVFASAFKLIRNKNLKTVILLGDNQFSDDDIISVWAQGKWETPLGEVVINESLAQQLLNFSQKIVFEEKVHLLNFNLEIQIPFLQKSLKNFQIIPILIGKKGKWEKLVFPILNLVKKKNVLVVCASNLSFSHSPQKTQKIDKKFIQAILALDGKKFQFHLKKAEKEGAHFGISENSVKLLIEITKALKGKSVLLKYQTSQESIFGEKFEVKGYGAFAFFRKDSEEKRGQRKT